MLRECCEDVACCGIVLGGYAVLWHGVGSAMMCHSAESVCHGIGGMWHGVLRVWHGVASWQTHGCTGLTIFDF